MSRNQNAPDAGGTRADLPKSVTRPRAQRRTFATSLAIAILAIAVPGPPSFAAPSDWEPIPAEAWTEPARPDSGGGDAIVLLDRDEYHDDQGSFRYLYFGRARIFTADGRDIATIEIPYPRDQWKLTGVRGRSVQPDGRSTEFDPAQLVEVRALKYGGQDLTRATMAIPGVEPGCMIEWTYTLEGPSQQFGSWRFEFANRVYTCLSQHTWHPSSWRKDELRRNWKFTGILSPFVEVTTEPDNVHPRVVTFSVRHLPGAREEEFAPPSRDAAPRVTVFYGDDQTTPYWSNWKRGIDAYQDEMSKSLGPLEDVMKAIRARHPEPESALVASFRWVQGRLHSLTDLPPDRRPDADHIRKSYKPAPSLAALLGRESAMPYEINALMVAAAHELGYTAMIGIAGDRRSGGFDHRIRGFPPFNFVTIVETPGGRTYLEPDSRFEPYGGVAWYLRGGDCLISGHTDKLFMRIPADAGVASRADWRLQVQLGAGGSMDGRVEAQLTGEQAADWRRELWDVDEGGRAKWIQDRLAEHAGPRTVFEPPDLTQPGGADLTLRGTASWPDVATVAGDRIVVPIEKLIPWRTQARFGPPKRRQSVLFRNAGVEVFRATLRLAPGMRVEQLPAPVEARNDLGSWSVRCVAGDGQVTVERRLELAHAEVGTQDYPKLRELFEGLDRADQVALVVSKTP